MNLREGPGRDRPIQTVAPGAPTSGQPIRVSSNELVWIIDTRNVGSEPWYQIVVERTFRPGWISAGPAADPWIQPFDRLRCPGSAADAFANATLDRQAMRSLVCFGSERVSLLAYWPTPEETGVFVPCPWSEPRWLLCYEIVNTGGDGKRTLPVYGTTELPVFERGRWVTIDGHYDDRRSKGCPDALGRSAEDAGEVAASILYCRTRLVADAVSPAQAP